MKLIYLFMKLFFLVFVCYSPASAQSGSMREPATVFSKSVSDSLQYKIIDGISNTYGYDIYKLGRKLIHQPSVPCIKGNKGFNSRRDARKVALLVMKKIREGQMPPSLTIKEMKAAGVVL